MFADIFKDYLKHKIPDSIKPLYITLFCRKSRYIKDYDGSKHLKVILVYAKMQLIFVKI